MSAIIGPASSDVAIAIREDAETLKVPVLLHMAGSERAIGKDNRFLFRTVDPSSLSPCAACGLYRRARLQGGVARSSGTTRPASRKPIHCCDSSSSPCLAQVYIETAPLLETDFTPYIQRLARHNPHVILLAGHPSGT